MSEPIMIPCRAHGGVPGGECYYSLANDPACGDTPCMIEPGPVVGGVKTYKSRIHPSLTKFRCTDRDDGCGRCPRSEPHEHPDEQQGDECDRMGKKVKCEVVK